MLLEMISDSLKLPRTFVQGIGRKASHSYKVYQIPKRTGGFREIAHPAKPLKALQRWLLHSVVGLWPVHDAAFAYVKGRGIRAHAERHATSRYLLRLDFESFFPSIRGSDILAYLATKPPGTETWAADDYELFVRLCCRVGHLSIGAPTSPALSNALCLSLDHQSATLAGMCGAVYTRYADDLFFSTARRDVLKNVPDSMEKIIRSLPVPANLRLNPAKLRHSSKASRRQVTGIVLSSDGRAILGRDRKRRIRSQIHRFDTLLPKDKASLRGMIAFATSIEPSFMNDLVLKYGLDRIEEVRG